MDRGRLRAAARPFGHGRPREKFKVLQGHVNAPTWLNSDYHSMAFKSAANGRYVFAELGWTGNRRGLLRAPEPDHGGSLGDLLHGLVRHLRQRVRLPRRQASGRWRSTSPARRFWLPWAIGPRDYYDD